MREASSWIRNHTREGAVFTVGIGLGGEVAFHAGSGFCFPFRLLFYFFGFVLFCFVFLFVFVLFCFSKGPFSLWVWGRLSCGLRVFLCSLFLFNFLKRAVCSAGDEEGSPFTLAFVCF